MEEWVTWNECTKVQETVGVQTKLDTGYSGRLGQHGVLFWQKIASDFPHTVEENWVQVWKTWGKKLIIASRKAQAWLRLSDMNFLSEPVVEHTRWVCCPLGQRGAGGRSRISCRIPIKESVLARESALPQWGHSAQPENFWSLGWDGVLGDSHWGAVRFRSSFWFGRLLPDCPAGGEDRS